MLDVFNYCQVKSIGANFTLRNRKKSLKKKKPTRGDISLVTLYYLSILNQLNDWTKICLFKLTNTWKSPAGLGGAALLVAVLAQPGVLGTAAPCTPPLDQGAMPCWRHVLSVRLPEDKLTFPVLVFLFFVYQTRLSLPAAAKEPGWVRQR